MTVKKTHKLDIFDTLAAIDRKDYGYLDRQPEESRKGFAPPVALRWTSSVTGQAAEYYLEITNRVANLHFHDLHQYPDLQYRLLAACGIGGRQNHKWIGGPKSSSKKARTYVAQFFPLASHSEIDLLMSQFTQETFIEFVNQSGCPPKDTKDLVDAFKKEDR